MFRSPPSPYSLGNITIVGQQLSSTVKLNKFMLLPEHDTDLAANFIRDEHTNFISDRHTAEAARLFFQGQKKSRKGYPRAVLILADGTTTNGSEFMMLTLMKAVTEGADRKKRHCPAQDTRE